MFTVWNHKAFPNFICRQYDKSGKQWDIWPIRAWYQNMVSWHSGIKDMSPGLAPLFPSPVYHSAHFPCQIFFAVHAFPTAEPGPTRCIPRKSVFLCLTLYTHLTTNKPIKGPKTIDIKYTEPAMYADSFLVKSKVSL